MSASKPPPPPSARIRWEDKTPGNGDVYNVASIGYVGTVTESAFIIYTPATEHAGWLLSVRLIPGSQFLYGASPEELKDGAERWLTEFVTSLGATLQGGKCDCTISACECGGLAHHKTGCRWREGYGSRVIVPAPHANPAPAGKE